MTNISATDSTAAVSAYSQSELGDYIALMKPRVMSLSVFTALTGMVVAPGHIHPIIAFTALVFIAVGAGGAAVLNCWYDADIDRLMARTALRPLARDRIPLDEALAMGLILSGLSVMSLGLLVNWTAAALLAFTIAFYVVVYTMWLKRRTPQNIVIGGAAGALPPMIGWAAVTGGIELQSLLLFAIIFLWTPPHFWALSLYRSRDYERAGIPMLPCVAGKTATRKQILLYSLVMTAVAVVPAFTGIGGALYLAVSMAGGVVFLALALRVYRRTDGHAADAAARSLFFYSILYLFALFAAPLVEHTLRLIR